MKQDVIIMRQSAKLAQRPPRAPCYGWPAEKEREGKCHHIEEEEWGRTLKGGRNWGLG